MVKGQETSGIIEVFESILNPEGCPIESFTRMRRHSRLERRLIGWKPLSPDGGRRRYRAGI